MDGCDHTVELYIYDDDDPSISGGCIHTLDLRFTDDPSHLDGCTHSVDLFHSPYYPDGCIHTLALVFDIKYLYLYASFISRSPDSVFSHPCKSL